MIFIDNALEEFEEITKAPDGFLSTQEVSSNKIKRLLKTAYDFTKNEEQERTHSQALPELIVQDFDYEQIWQQLELQNNFITKSITTVSKFVTGKHRLLFNELKADGDEASLIEEEKSDVENDEIEEDKESQVPADALADKSSSDELSLGSDDESDHESKQVHRQKKTYKKSVVDDNFFKLSEMENFLLSEEKKLEAKEPDSGNDTEGSEEEEAEDDVDLFEASDKEEYDDANNPKYDDFFGEPQEEKKKDKRNKFFEEMDESDAESYEKDLKSTLEQREERLKRKIEHIEESALQEKSWQLKGEITAEKRPQNSLLQEIVEFDISTRPAPVITEETSLRLEDIIKQRIKDKVFDSVVRKEKPVETPLEYKKKLVLDQEKSKESLAQIYEKEYLEQKASLDPDAADKVEVEPELHKEIKQMMHSLFTKLDSLSNFHFTPKPAAPELRIVSNLPAINMEEVAPVAASDAALLAPEEVKRNTKGDVIGKSERTDADKNRERRKKKAMQRQHANEKKKMEDKLLKLKPGLGNKYTKEKAKKLLENVTKHKNIDKMDESYGSKAIKSSTAFFTQLQDEVKSQIKTKSNSLKRKNNKKSVDAKKMKL